MKKKERIIFQTMGFNTMSREEQVEEYLQVMSDRVYAVEELKKAEEVTDADLVNFQNDEQEMWFDSEKENLDLNIATDILAVASLGLWNGRRRGYRTLGNNLAEVFRVWNSCEDIKLYVEDRDVKGIGRHHDGTNYVTFRAWKKNISEAKKEELLKELYYGEDNADVLIKKYTRSIAKDVASIYGW